MSDPVSYRESHKAKGADYHRNFCGEVNLHRAMVWELEREALDDILKKWYPDRKPHYLDFACGTGRIIEHLAEKVEDPIGIDISASMLEVARTNLPDARFFHTDITRADPLDDRLFELITAFRFFPNAEPELRREVITKISKHLAPNGILVMNNHKNSASLLRFIARTIGRAGKGPMMSHGQVKDLVEPVGLKVVRRIPVASVPCSETHVLRPIWLLKAMERVATKLPAAAAIAQNVIYVCRKDP